MGVYSAVTNGMLHEQSLSVSKQGNVAKKGKPVSDWGAYLVMNEKECFHY